MSFATLADRVGCINLVDREDRYEAARQRFAAVGLGDGRVQFYRVRRHPLGPLYGCYDSHRRILRDAYEDRNCNRVMVFEDDVVFWEGWERVVEIAHDFIQNSGVDFDALFLGGTFHFVEAKTTPSVWRVKCGQAHAYIVSRQGLETFIHGPGANVSASAFKTMGHDFLYNSVWQNVYAVVDSDVIDQDCAMGTDNHWIKECPPRWAPWLQTVVVVRYCRWIQRLIRSDWWMNSWMGRRYALAIDDATIDDGRITLYGLWWLDTVGIFTSLIYQCIISRPPFGYFALLKDSVVAVKNILQLRLNGRKDSNIHMGEENDGDVGK